MGSTFISFKNIGFEANDSAMEVWLMLLVDEIDKLNTIPKWLNDAREEWFIQCTSGFGFGVMPGLDVFLISNERVSIVLKLSFAALKRLENYGEKISNDDLNVIMKANNVSFFTENVETQRFSEVGVNFINLLHQLN